MKIKFAVIIILFLLVSCWKDIDDTNNNCTNDCTTISGRIVTEDGTVPASELNFQLDWKIQSELGGTYRNIKKFKSDKNGFFDISFHVTDQELYWKGGYAIKYLDSDKNYVDLNDHIGDYPVVGVVDLSIRDTLINKTVLIPRRSFIRFKMLNSTIQTVCIVYYKYGDVRNDRSYHSGGRIDSKEQLEKVVEAAGNQMNYLNINKFPGDKIISIKDSIYVPPGDTITFNIN